MASDLNQFAEDFRQEVAALASLDDAEIPVLEAFTDLMIQELCDAGVLDEGEVAPFEARGMAVSGYSISDDGSLLSLLVAIHKQSVPPMTVNSAEIERGVQRAVRFYTEAASGLASKLEESTPAFDMAIMIQDAASSIAKIRILLVTDGQAVLRERPTLEVDGVEVSTEVWDIVRLFQLASSGRLQESISIDFVSEFGKPIPCLPAPSTKADYAAHLAVIPGEILAEVYDRYGPRLLERNVRSFLQARGKVNSGIRRTILDEPERFLAYNNGISATASDVEVVRTSDGGYGIASVADLQIVNGGQTTASIHHLAKRDREKGKVDLSPIYVQAKFTVVPAEKLDEIVPLISLYANSQNKVNAADFQANSPFHVSIVVLSRSVWAPGEPRLTHWFYERARGQYQDAVNRASTPARKREFKLQNPPRQKFTKTDLAKFENCWDQLPHLVSQGAEKNFRQFTIDLERRGKFVVDRAYFERLIGKAIFYRRTEQLITEQGFGGYRANTVAYTISYISSVTDQRIDLLSIWQEQDISEALAKMIRRTCREVREILVAAPGNGNVTEWCKKAECWTRVRSLRVPVTEALRAELAEPRPEEWRLDLQVLDALARLDRPLGKLDILKESGIPEASWTHLIDRLVRSGRVVKTGNTRGAAYSLPSEAD